MKKFTLILFMLSACFTVQADGIAWSGYETITSQHNQITVLNRKLKIIELSALRKWQFLGQTKHSLTMSIKSCKAKVEFNENNTIIKHNGKDGWGDMLCKAGWMKNLKKDIVLSSKILAFQQEAIEMDKIHSQKGTTLSE